MKIIGIDPGIARIGWAVIETKGYEPNALAFGCITTDQKDTPQYRLHAIHTSLSEIFKKYSPDIMSIEDLFFGTNTTTAFVVGQARGVILLIAEEHHIPAVSYTPLAVKRAICGDGQADKKQILYMVMKIFKLTKPPKPDDTADAMAIAATHAYSYKMKGKTI